MCTHINIPVYLYLQGYRRDAAHILYPKTLQGAIYALVMPLQDQGAEGESNQTPISNKTSISLVCSDLLLERYPWAAPIDSEDGRGGLGGGWMSVESKLDTNEAFRKLVAAEFPQVSHAHTHTHLHTHIRTHTHTHIHTHTHTHTHAHTHTDICTPHTRTRTQVPQSLCRYVCICARVCMYMYVAVCVFIYIYMHVYTYIHILNISVRIPESDFF